MSITSATLAQPIGTQPIQGQFSAPAMSTTYLPITPDFVSSPSKLSIAQLTDRIDSCVQAYLSPTFLDSLLTSLQPVDHSPHHPVHDVSTPLQDLTIQKLAATYSETCSLIWQQSLTSAPSLALSLTATHPLYFSLQSLTLCWVTGKYHHPDSPFFCDAITLGALQSKWRYPAIQSSLRHTTANLRRVSPYDQWLAAYPTCWSYAVGRTMHQLLQWNYRLPPSRLRELLILD